jgi:hypothetical protein
MVFETIYMAPFVFEISALTIFRARLGCGKIPLRTRPQPVLEPLRMGKEA